MAWLTSIPAILGALAWIPHLISVIIKILEKPRLEVLSDNWAEIGFTELGPIFNPKLAFYAKNSSVLITRITSRVTHESGRETLFEWQFIVDRDGTDDAIGLNVTRDEMTVALIRMQSPDLIEKAEKVNRAYQEHLNHQTRTGQMNLDDFLKAKTTIDRIDFRKNNPLFEAGKYTVVFEVETRHAAIIESELVEFEVSQDQVNNLAKNKDNFELLEKTGILKEKYDKSQGWPQWSWEKVKIKKAANNAVNQTR